MKKLILSGLLVTITLFSFSQKNVDKIINAKEVKRIENKLASDVMKGRKIFTPEIDKAAEFIAAEFKKAGLETWNNATSYLQEFKLGDVVKSSKNGDRRLANVVGVLPGKSKKDEYVIFSGHYDHIGIGKAINGDSIYNGANDDAAGITAVILLAKYFKALNNNERTIIFAAFTAEEVGGFGSNYFSQQFDAGKVMAMFNIEMIGTQSKWGKNTAFITGYEKTDMGAILQNNLKGTDFTFHPDPYPDMQLFYRSDNATLARLGVPAHTISTAKMEDEPHYHKPSDEVKTLDLKNMAMIIKSIALSSRGIIAGKETPTRVKVEELRK